MFVLKAKNMSEFMQYDAFLSRHKDIVVSSPAQAHSRVFLSSCLPVRYGGDIRIRAGERDTDSGR